MAPLLAWCWLLLFRGRFWLRFPHVPRQRGAGRVIAVIPARDEEATIAAAVESLAGQVERVIVVDDHSRDGTAAAARAAGAQVVAAGALPVGWTGKLWAVSEGLRAAGAYGPEFVLLTDADIVHGAGSVARLLGLASSRDLVSVMARLRCESWAERLLIPAFVFFFFKLYPPAWVADPRRRTAGAAGGCMLVRAAALARIGGVKSIRRAIIDDCALARAVKRSGGAVWLGVDESTVSLRVYHGPEPVWRMISRTAFAQLRHSPALLALTLAGMGVLYVAPPALAFTGSVFGAAAWALMCAAYIPMLRLYRRSPLWAPLLPAAALFYGAATVDSALRYWLGRGGQWKGRSQDLR